MKKTITLTITQEDHPFCFIASDDNLPELCQTIFSTGYAKMFPSSASSNIDSIKNDLEIIKNKIDSTQHIDNLSSAKKGKYGEDIVNNFLKERFKDFPLEETRNIPHYGDSLLKIPNEKNIITSVIIEVKNYTKPVDPNEINKLIFDMKYRNIKYSIFISLKSSFVGKRNMCIHEFTDSDETYYIIFLPNVNSDTNRIESSILLMEKLILLNESNKRKINLNISNNLSEHFNKLESVYFKYSTLKNKYIQLENTIKQSLSDYYSELRNYEFEFKTQIIDIWKSVDSSLNEIQKEISKSNETDKVIESLKSPNSSKLNKYLINIFDIIKKNNISLRKTLLQSWNIANTSNNQTIGFILKNEKDISIKFFNPCLTITIKNKKDILKFDKTIKLIT